MSESRRHFTSFEGWAWVFTSMAFGWWMQSIAAGVFIAGAFVLLEYLVSL